jgi:cytoskeletal protein RodZ
MTESTGDSCRTALAIFNRFSRTTFNWLLPAFITCPGTVLMAFLVLMLVNHISPMEQFLSTSEELVRNVPAGQVRSCIETPIPATTQLTASSVVASCHPALQPRAEWLQRNESRLRNIYFSLVISYLLIRGIVTCASNLRTLK